MSLTNNPRLSAFEATSFMNKFKDLWHSGHKATLSFETEAGQAWATIKVALGPHPVQQKHETSKERRLRRRAADRAAAEEAASARNLPPFEAEEAISTENDTTDNKVKDTTTTVEETEVVQVESQQVAEEATVEHCCNLCARTFGTLRGLKAHQGRQHKPSIPQIDGAADETIDYDLFCEICGNCHEETKSSDDLSYHLMNDHEVVEVMTSYGQKWIEERLHCIRRGSPFQHLYPPH